MIIILSLSVFYRRQLMLRIGMLTSGGDCQALNAAMRGVFKAVTRNSKEPVEFIPHS